MKTIFAFILSAFSTLIFAQEQKTIYVLNGYTLEPLTEFTATCSDEKTTLIIEGNVIGVSGKKQGQVVISKEGYTTQYVELDRTEEQFVIAEPTVEEKKVLRAEYFPPMKQDEENATTPLVVVDERAEFPGGNPALYKFLGANINYPRDEIEYGISGKIYVKFIVEEDGSITNISIAKGGTLNMEKECIRIVKLMPKWTPSKKDGIVVRSYFNLPVQFTLN